MGYIIVAECDLSEEDNGAAKISEVDARILVKNDDVIKFDIKGDFLNKQELTKKLCDSLINAGFLSFEIYHSY